MVVLYTPPDVGVSTRGLTLGLAVGVGFPGGFTSGPNSAAGSSGLASDQFGVMIPFTATLGYRISPHWYVGGYFSGGYVTGSATCNFDGTDDASCSSADYRFGFDVEYNFLPSRTWQPWLGGGAGWEVTNNFFSDTTNGPTASSANGVEFAHVTAGIDYRLTDRDKLGLYGLVAFDTYDNGYVHEWYMIGMRWRHDTNWLYR
jgi:hypothetical protein